jgi:tRNA A-37 threonylcarbamoyl transferase component Bud32
VRPDERETPPRPDDAADPSATKPGEPTAESATPRSTGADPYAARPGEPVPESTPTLILKSGPTPTDYEVLRQLGRGGMGVVYEARDRRRGRIVALKTVQHSDAAALYRFKQEFRALADVAHPNLVSLYELVAEGDSCFFTMELVEGVDFKSYVRGGSGAVDPGRLRAALRQLAGGVCALHAAGQLHRDIKPSNVLVTNEGRVVLLDFGLAGALDVEGMHHSTELHVMGTVAYMAPEQAACRAVGPAADWYSVGALLYEALTGRLPFTGPALLVLQDKQQADPPPPRALAPEVPEDLNTLCMELLRREPRDRPSGAEVLARLGGTPVPPPAAPVPRSEVLLIGRDRQLEMLERAVAAVSQGRTVTACVHGRSGLGKSALVQHFLNRLRERGDVLILAGRCYERESVPFKVLDPLIDALSRQLGHLPAAEVQAVLPRDVGALVRVFPVLQQVEAVRAAPRRAQRGADAPAEQQRRELAALKDTLPQPEGSREPAGPDPQELRRRAFAALRELLARLGDRRPLVLASDDVQWGDADSAALLAEVLRPPDAPALLLLVCYRAEDAATSPFLQALLPALAPGDASREHHDVAVEPLTPAEARALALTRLGRVDPTREAQARVIAEEAAGSPLFVLELAQHVLGGAELTEGAEEITLEQVLAARVAALPAGARALLEVVAVAGHPVRQGDAWRATGVHAEGQEAVILLRTARLLRSTGPGEQDLLETYHDRVRETLVARLTPEVRQGYHGRLAQVLEAVGDADPEVLAGHFAAAGERDRAGEWYSRAAAQAAVALAFGRAVVLYRHALELRPGGPDEKRRLRARLADALANAGRGPEAAQEYFAAAAEAGPVEALELRKRAAQQLLLNGDVEEGLRTLREVLAAVDLRLATTPGRALLALLLRRAWVRLRGLGYHERPAVQVAEDELRRIDIAWAGAMGLMQIDPLASADLQVRHLLLALRAGEPYRIARALALEALFAAIAGRPDNRRSETLLEAARALTARIDHPHARGLVCLAAGLAAQVRGQWKAARAQYEQAEQVLRDQCQDVAWEVHTAQAYNHVMLLSLGEIGELSRRLPVLYREAQDRGRLYAWKNDNGFLRPLLCLFGADLEGAREALADYQAQLPRQGLHLQHIHGFLLEAELHLYTDQGKLAWESLARHWPRLARSLFMRFQIVRILVRELRARCALAAAVQSPEPEPLLREADRDAGRLERERRPWAMAHARLLRAGAAAARGDRVGAARLLAEAARAFEAADMALYAAVARHRLGELVGGAGGQELVAAAEEWMAGQQIRDPGRATAVLAPGFPPGPSSD